VHDMVINFEKILLLSGILSDTLISQTFSNTTKHSQLRKKETFEFTKL